MLLTHQDFMNLTTGFTTEFVVIDTTVPSPGLELAHAGGFLFRLSAEYFKCKRSIAEDFELSIISDYPN